MAVETRIGIDVGGTFTDVVTVRDGSIDVLKTPTTPEAPVDGVVAGVEAAAAEVFDPGEVTAVAHGTTVATNCVLEGELADTVLLTTDGFRDVLEIGRQDRPDLYDFRTERPPVVIERHRRLEVPERLDEHGKVVRDLDEAAVRAMGTRIRDSDVESVAVALLFSFENADHERRVRSVLREVGIEAPVSLSSDVLPAIREYERTLATALNAGLRPVMDRYLGDLHRRLGELGVPCDPRVMQSNGGVMTTASARERPVETLLSGPAAGVTGAAFVAETADMPDAITMDMGGTSCDVSLLRAGEPVVSTDVTVGPYPVGVPSVDVHTIGAGGGSIGWVDAGGALRVGPHSAGAKPGPICYGRGGTRPTVTDAHVLLGRIDTESFGHGFETDRSAVRRGFEAQLGEPLDMSVEAAARGVVEVAEANMERALRVVSIERGHDPRRLGLVAYGGAGPLHATAIAARMELPRVLVPRAAGVLSAVGLIVSDVVHRFARSMVRPWAQVSPFDLRGEFEAFENAATDRLAADGIPADRRRFERAFDLRYTGQTYDITIPLEGPLHGDGLEAAARRFHERHRARYGHANSDEPLELTGIRLVATGVTENPRLRSIDTTGTVAGARTETRSVSFGDRRRETAVYDRGRLPAGGAIEGPAVIEGAESTTIVQPEHSARVDEVGNLLVEVGQ